MKNKFLVLLIVALMLISSVGTVFAAEDSVITVFVDGEQIQFDVPPISENGRTLVPMRYIFEALGAEVNWIQEENKAVATKGDITVEIVLGNNIMTKNGKEITLDVPAKAINGRTLVPARAVSEALDAVVNWIGEEFKVDIVSKAEAAAVLDENEAQVREILESYYDAILELDLKKAAQYCSNTEEIIDNLPEDKTLETIICDIVTEMGKKEGATEEEIDAVCSTVTPIIAPIVDAFLDSMEITITDVKSGDGSYTYTVNYAYPSSEKLEEYFSTEEFANEIETISGEASIELMLNPSIQNMSEAETAQLFVEIFGKKLFEKLSKDIKEIEKISDTEIITVVYKDGKWLVEMPEEDLSALDYESLIEALLQ